MGATTTLRLALHQPEFFSILVLIDPVLFHSLDHQAMGVDLSFRSILLTLQSELRKNEEENSRARKPCSIIIAKNPSSNA